MFREILSICDREVFMGFKVTRSVSKREILAQYFLSIILYCFQILQANKRHAHITEDTPRHVLSDEVIYTHFIRFANNHSDLAQNTIPGQRSYHLIGQESNRRRPHPKTSNHVD